MNPFNLPAWTTVLPVADHGSSRSGITYIDDPRFGSLSECLLSLFRLMPFANKARDFSPTRLVPVSASGCRRRGEDEYHGFSDAFITLRTAIVH